MHLRTKVCQPLEINEVIENTYLTVLRFGVQRFSVMSNGSS